MIRENLTSGSIYALMGASPDGTLQWQNRTNTSGGTVSSKVGAGGAANVSGGAGGTPAPPGWVRLVRSGNVLSAYESGDGINWTSATSSTNVMAANIYAGLVVASGGTNTLNTSTFTDVTVVP